MRKVSAICAHPGCTAKVVAPIRQAGRMLCDYHRLTHRQESVRKETARRSTGNPPGAPETCIRILSDPDPDGGFPDDAEIPAKHLPYMLQLGNFTIGTIIERRACVYRIAGSGKQYLIRIGE